MNSFSVHNIIFSNEFSTDQRKRIHLIARKLKLHSSSIGREPNRQLTVRRSRRKRPLVELLNELFESQGEDPLFEKMCLIPPTE
ncbi:putative NF-kappa-B-repressing factor [Daphnia magna]|uniref:Putative NF-kappa-B-repressing factor n=1 Tax=Daphnia magna TaxID=35525 RepID=A0A164G3K0_9CRUS|nr:putative NF-kappa-B-repressing factor [Daphnia magna]